MTLAAPSLLDRVECRIGQTIREKYRLDRVLGVGGMAAVYLATHRNGSRAALKILHAELAVHDVHRERFIREAYVANSIGHPGAVRVVDDDVAEDNCPYLVMELLEGETLEARRRRLGRLEPREVLRFAHTLCDTLAAAHDNGVVHRDIKPENVFLTNLGTLKVLDFGIARVFHESSAHGTRTGAMMGTPAFMPPEQALGRRAEIDGRTDIWAVGATMFTLLSGQFVHQAESPEEMMVRAATQPAAALADVLPEIPLPIAAIVDHALAFKRDERFPSAHIMRDAIELAHQGAFGEALEAMPMFCGPPSVSPSSRQIAPSHSASVVTLLACDTAGTESTPTVVDDPGIATVVDTSGIKLGKDDAPTVVDVVGVQPTVSQILQASQQVETRGSIELQNATSVHSPPARTYRSGELVPLSKRSQRRRLIVGIVTFFTLVVSAFVGVKHVTGGPVEKPRQVRSCAQSNECQVGERCNERGLCSRNVGCVSNAECVAEGGGKPAICRRDFGRCVQLETAQCRVFAEKTDLENDETVWLGAMYPETDKSMTYGPEAMLTVDLARRDFSNLTGGLPPLKPGGRPRPIAVVACDDTADYERAAQHLIDVVGVPAIQGFGWSKEVLDLASRHFIPKGILALASNTASMISSIPHGPGQPRLVFRVTTEATMTARAKAGVIREIVEPNLRAAGGSLGSSGVLRIAVLRSVNASGTSHVDAIVKALEQLGSRRGVAREEIRPFAFDDTSEGELTPKDHERIRDVLAFAPHVLVDGGPPVKAFEQVELNWPNSLAHRPWHMIAGSVSEEPVRSLALSHKTVPSRLMGINPSAESPATRTFRMRFREAYPNHPDGDDVNAAPYDAFYIFAYAAMSLGQTPINGTNLAHAVKRLLAPGEPVDVGPSGILPAFKALAAGNNIDLSGAQTSLDFDLETGDPSCDFEVNCFDRKTRTSTWGGLIFRARTGKLEGTWKCP